MLGNATLLCLSQTFCVNCWILIRYVSLYIDYVNSLWACLLCCQVSVRSFSSNQRLPNPCRQRESRGAAVRLNITIFSVAVKLRTNALWARTRDDDLFCCVSVLDRLQSFLPQMAEANEKLKKQMAEAPAGTFDIESVEEAEKVIEMVSVMW